jgi:hypothetical protein
MEAGTPLTQNVRVDLLTTQQTRLLAFIDACNTSGYRPTAEEVTLWLRSPQPRLPTSRLAASITSTVSTAITALISGIEPGSGEDHVAHAQRILWVSSEERLSLTRLGAALLRSGERSQANEAGVDVVELAREDPLAYPRLVARLATSGPSLLADPYLRLEQLHDLVVETEVARVLISKQQKASKEIRAGIATYLGSPRIGRAIEVRASADNDVHDRVLVEEHGSVYLIGYSLNGIKAGTASTVLVRLPDAAAVGQRERAEAWWADAEPVVPSMPILHVSESDASLSAE